MINIQDRVRESIAHMEYGAVFSVYDFLMYGCYDTIKRTLHRIEVTHTIERIMNGLYYKPSPLGTPPEMKRVAQALARKFSWTLTPSREHCLYELGLSKKDDDGSTFLSSGPARHYDIFGRKLTFHHTQSKDITGISEKSAMVVEALRGVGRGNITVRTLSIIRSRLTIREMETMRRECTGVTNWIYDAIVAMTCLEV